MLSTFVPMSFEGRYTVSANGARGAYLAYLRDSQVGYLVSMPLLLVFGTACAFDAEFRLLAGFLIGAATMLATNYWQTYRLTVRGARAYAGQEIKFRVTEEGLHFASADGDTFRRWAAFKQLRRQPAFWFFILAGNRQPFYLPTSSLPSEAQAFIEQTVRAAGGRVI